MLGVPNSRRLTVIGEEIMLMNADIDDRRCDRFLISIVKLSSKTPSVKTRDGMYNSLLVLMMLEGYSISVEQLPNEQVFIFHIIVVVNEPLQRNTMFELMNTS